MQSNLRKLESQKKRIGGSKRGSSRQRRRIKRALTANRCNELRPVVASNRSGVLIERRVGRRSIVEQIYGNSRRDRREYRERDYDEYGERVGRRPRGNTFRTLCVRACDGYYFPISFSTIPSNFDRDAQSCNAKCPGTPTDLYYHSARGESAEDMISYSTQEPYANLENAFSYRKTVTAGCGCKFNQPGHLTLAGDGKNPKLGPPPNDEYATLATPTFRIDAGEDPETLANKRGSFFPSRSMAKSPAKNPKTASGQRKIRVVGQSFFPTQ